MSTIDQRDLGICAERRKEEWDVLSVRLISQVHYQLLTILQSIYPDCVSRDVSNNILKFEVPIELERPTDVFITGSEDAKLQESHLSLSSLPPVLLEIVLPPAYPLLAAPEIVSFHVSGSWIPRSGRLLKKLQGMWQPGEVVLYTWVELIRSADFLDPMNIIQDDALRCVI
jgi:E3 ubiquitin-protein ligase RNF14